MWRGSVFMCKVLYLTATRERLDQRVSAAAAAARRSEYAMLHIGKT